MIQLPWWVKTAALATLAAGSYWLGASSAKTECELATAERDVVAYGSQLAMQARVDLADSELAEKQAVILQGVSVETIKYRVVYRDKIKDPAVRDAVVDSGLLELYRSAYGFTVSGGGPVDAQGAVARPWK